MSDSTSWASPGSVEPEPRPSTAGSPFGSPSGFSPSGPLNGAGWTPPPRPGLIPLRPLELGTVLGASFQLLRRNPRPTFGAALLLNALVVFLSTGISTVIVLTGFDRAARANASDAETILAGTIALMVVSALLAVGVSVVAQAILQGIISIEVARATVGDKRTLPELIVLGRGRWWALIGWTSVLAIAVIIGISILVALGFGFFATNNVTFAAIGVLLLLFGGLLFAVGSVYLATKLAFVPSAIVIERLTIPAAIVRSWRLVGGAFWRVFGTLALVTIMVNTAASIVTAPFQLAATFTTPLVNPAGDLGVDLGLFITLNVVLIAVTAVVGAIGSVLSTAASSLLYIDRRMRTEGLDLDLQRYVELRASGAPAADPYLRDAGPGTR